MRRGTVFSFNRFKFVDFMVTNRAVITLLVAFCIGLVISSVAFTGNIKISAFGKSAFEAYYSARAQVGFAKIFSNSFLFYLLLLTVNFIFGTTMFGVIVVPILNFLLGILYGSLSAYVCNAHSLTGIAFNAIVVVPTALVPMVVLLFSAKEAINFSFNVARLSFSKAQLNDIPFQFKRLCIINVSLIVAIFIAAILDAAISTAFLKLFKF